MNTYDMDIYFEAADSLATVDVRTLDRPHLEKLRTEAAAAGDWAGVKTCSIVLSGLTEVAVQAMYDREDPEMPRLFDYLGEVRAYVVDSLVADGSVVDDADAEFDVDAIVHAASVRADIGGRDVYYIAIDNDAFWSVVQRYAR